MNIPRKLALPLDYSGAAFFFVICMYAAYHGLALMCIAGGLSVAAFSASIYWRNLEERGFRDHGLYLTCKWLAILAIAFFLMALVSWVLS